MAVLRAGAISRERGIPPTRSRQSEALSRIRRRDGERVLRLLRVRGSGQRGGGGEVGALRRLAEPGLHFFNPFAGECVAGTLTTRVQSLDVRVETKTRFPSPICSVLSRLPVCSNEVKYLLMYLFCQTIDGVLLDLQDNVFVQLICTIQYRVVKENADDAFYELQNPQQQIQAYVFDVPRMNLDDLFEQKNDVAKAVLEELEKVMADYGYSIEHILMVDIIPDAAVRKVMNDINAGIVLFHTSRTGSSCSLNRSTPITAQRLQLASIYKGEAEKILLVKKAEAEAEAEYLSGVGIAKQRQAITDGLRENILNFSHSVSGTSAKEVMDLIMVTQYFDTIKELGDGSKNTTVFIPHGPGHVKDISEQIRDGMMQASSSNV
ncbi:hypothetical protein HU200_015154 [Digitaria exilis]|uniref:Band 7 domain-containing protein n=1 Tax=Digitaria exilis TaxID=1010633 RepID=A0A835FA94_9POAL|nr:hypothetical protein HU200_015154 [Digitaria exilis]